MSKLEKKLKETQRLFGKQIQQLRKEQGLTQLDLAVKCDWEKTTISRIENGRTNVTLKTVLILSHALDVPMIELLTFDT